MAERSLRGMRLGTQSMQSEEGVEFAPRIRAVYQAEDGSTFEMVFDAEAEIPPVWESARTGQEGILLGPDGKPVDLEQGEVKAARTHWDMLLERRSIPELEEILQERLDILRERRGQRKSA